MDIVNFLYQLLIMPLQILFEEIYYFAFYITKSPGVAIVVFSFIVSLLLLPLYHRADLVQQEERSLEDKMAKGVEHIKKTFSSDEQLMMLQTYYRKNNYNPVYSLRGSLSLILQIPFFIAAYQFLSNLEILKGTSCGFINDLSAPDALFNLAGLSINLLPIIMTLVNLVSTYIFTQGLSLKTKIQLNTMTLLFLVFLYNAPAGLVLYWTCNNVFSLVKSIIKKLKNPENGVYFVLSLCSVIVVIYGLFSAVELQTKVIGRIFLYALALNLPYIVSRFVKVPIWFKLSVEEKTRPKIFVFSTIFLAMLVGGVIPSAVIVSSPQEFIVGNYLVDPTIYIIHTIVVSLGAFVLWLGVCYWVSEQKYRVLFEKIIWFSCCAAIVNYMCFGNNLGLLTTTLEFENGMTFSSMERYINIVVMIMVIIFSYYVWKLYKNYLVDVLVVGTISLMCLVVINFIDIKASVKNVYNSFTQNTDLTRILNLSKTGKNVIVFMLDRGIGLYVPYIFNEKPGLKEKFSGFTYYSNTVSFGAYTNFTTPSLFGGYEYTPIEMNKRSQETLMNKHNEAIRVMPILFNKHNYNVTVCDPSYANYQIIPDVSLYDEYSGIKKYRTIGKFGSRIEKTEELVENSNTVEMNKRNFFLFGIMKCTPVSFQRKIYNRGQYNKVMKDSQNQEMTSLYSAKNTSKRFLARYNVLKNLPNMTNVTDDGNSFIMMVNHTTHEPCLLQAPEYIPSSNIDNYEYEINNGDRFVFDGVRLRMSDHNQMIHYHANMAALIQLGNWFDYMRDNGVYDNTRIIVVADHGRALKQVDEFVLDDGTDYLADIQHYYPLFMVKDFNKNTFNVSEEFMTNADVVTIATRDIIENPLNPFTGKLISNSSKFAGKQYILSSNQWNVDINNGNSYLPGKWYSVHTDMRDKNNWELVKQNDVLPY